VSSVESKRRLFDQVLRLRRAERSAPGNQDIVAVRSELEDELGGVVTPSLAAQILGVSHTALARWIRAGDVPVVPSPNGRNAVPVGALVDLYEAINRERAEGRRRRHTLEPVMVAHRKRADDLDPAKLAPLPEPDEDPHRRSQRRALAYHRALARRLRRPMIDDALHQVWRWRDSGRINPHYAAEWESVLRQPVRDVRRIISEDSREADDLRQNSPFAGMLSEAERRRVFADVR
jgi:hypothetical protein